jgi:hypothetical protein
MAQHVAQLRAMGLGSMLDDETLLSVLEQNKNDIDQTIDALFALGLSEEENGAGQGRGGSVRVPSPVMSYVPPPRPSSQPEPSTDEAEMNQMMKLLLGVDLSELEPKPAQASSRSAPHMMQSGQSELLTSARKPQDGFQSIGMKAEKKPSKAPGPALRDVRLVVLVGPPGCGKSTTARQFRAAGWEIVCQDELGNRQECEACVHQYLKEGRRVVVDRTNIDEQQRSTWIRIAQYVSILHTWSEKRCSYSYIAREKALRGVQRLSCKQTCTHTFGHVAGLTPLVLRL